MNRCNLALALVAAFAISPTIVLAAARADLRPGTELSVGSPAQLTITVDGDASRPAPPHVDNAAIAYSGQMSQTTVINGRARNETTYVYTIVPRSAGRLDIPAIQVRTSTGIETTAPLHATVTDQPVADTGGGSTAPRDQAPAADEPTRAFVSLVVPSKQLYVGQAMPVKIRAYFRGGTSATLLGPPKLSSDAFVLAELSDKPAQQQIEIRGVPYLQASWTAVLSPTKPSKTKLGVELPIEIAYRDPVQQHRRSIEDLFGGDPFGGDPFAASFFGGADPFADVDAIFDSGPVRQRKLTLRDQAGTLVVEEVPAVGKPAGFTGAVGAFTIAIDPIAGEPRVGEPLTITTRVTGRGNFDRVAVGGVAETAELKTYPIKSTFTPSAESKLSGEKAFTQTIIPTRDGDLVIPAIVLPYFDPIKRSYVSAQTEPQQLHVLPARGGGAADPGLSASVRDPRMTENRLDPGAVQATLAPRFRDAGFWVVPGGLALITLILVGMGWSRRSPRVLSALASRKLDRAVRHATRDFERAARGGDRVAFFTAARAALQLRLGARWRMAPDAVTPSDVLDHMGDDGAAIRSVFERADAVSYARGLPATESLDHWSTVVATELATLENLR